MEAIVAAAFRRLVVRPARFARAHSSCRSRSALTMQMVAVQRPAAKWSGARAWRPPRRRSGVHGDPPPSTARNRRTRHGVPVPTRDLETVGAAVRVFDFVTALRVGLRRERAERVEIANLGRPWTLHRDAR